MSNVTHGIREKIFALLRDRLRIPDHGQDLTIDASLQQLGLDSMTAIDLLLDLERTFGILLPESLLTAETFRTPATLEAAVRSLVEDSV